MAPAAMVPWLVVLACVLRIALRLWTGEAAFAESGYTLYETLAENLVNGTGLCLGPAAQCAFRVPLYPIFLAPWIASGWLFPGVVIAQALLGAAMVWLAWRIGRDLFDDRIGLVAAALVAISPYAAVHDTGMQDTVLANFLVLLAVALLWQARRHGGPALCLSAGVTLGAVVLTTARLTLLVPAVLVWAAIGAGPTWRLRLRSAVVIALPVALMVGAWVARNWTVVGAPVLTTESGESLWVANNAFAMTHYPAESIDLSLPESYDGMSPAEHLAYARVAGDEAGRDRLLRDWAMASIAADPLAFLGRAARKLAVPTFAELSPARVPILQWGYRIVFLPIHVLALAGLWRHRRDWRAHGLFGAVLASFAVTTGVFWAHTSHKSYLDALLFIYAAAAFRSAPGVSS